MANTYPETIFTVDDPHSPAAAEAPRRSWGRWLLWIVALVVFLSALDAGLSLYIRHSNLKQRFTAKLAAGFGRPVQVGSYDFSLWAGPTLTAKSLSVAEDPRFGAEYFVRADAMTVRLRWMSLLRGHFDIGTLSLTKPSVNVVRAANGDWNLANWLPDSSEGARRSGSNAPSGAVPIFERIEFTGGRINFKRGDDKLPLAFVDVAGSVDNRARAGSAGAWRIDVTASPWRAAELLQQAGTIHVAGQVGGTSSRLLPAALDVSWTDASVSDVLRLAQSYDDGIRGSLDVGFSAHTQGEAWILQGRAELRQLHRWDLAERADNPDVNLVASMKLSPLASGLEITQALLEARGSHAKVTGALIWDQPHPVGKHVAPPPASAIHLASSSVNLADVVSWMRAFDGDVGDDFKVQGTAAVDAQLTGWPLHLAAIAVNSAGAQLTAPRMREPVNVGAAAFRYDGERSSLSPVALWFGAPGDPLAGAFHVEAALPRNGKAAEVWHFYGGTGQVRDLLSAAGELGWNLSRGWELAGPLRCDLKWPAGELPGASEPSGFVEFGGGVKAASTALGASLHAPFLNLPVEQIHARADWQPKLHHIALAAAQGFGAHWSGTFDRSAVERNPPDADRWQFSLAADRMTASDLDRWLNPRWRESFLDRVLPYFSSRVGTPAVPEKLRASGRLSVADFTMAPVEVRELHGSLEIEGRHIELNDAAGKLAGGDVMGAFSADLAPEPKYAAKMDFSGVDVSSLTGGSVELKGLFDGAASGNIALQARGAARSDLLASLECTGGAQVRDAEIHGLDLLASLAAGGRQAGDSAFREASAGFSCKDREILFQDLLLLGSSAQVDGAGSVDGNHNLDFRLNLVPAGERVAGVSTAERAPAVQSYRLSGKLTAPEIAKDHAAPRSVR